MWWGLSFVLSKKCQNFAVNSFKTCPIYCTKLHLGTFEYSNDFPMGRGISQDSNPKQHSAHPLPSRRGKPPMPMMICRAIYSTLAEYHTASILCTARHYIIPVGTNSHTFLYLMQNVTLIWTYQ